MKQQTIIPILLAATLSLLFACNPRPTAENYLKDDKQRKDVITAMVRHQPYMTEMMNEMMNNDSCKQMMMDKMMSDESMKGAHMNKMMSMSKDDASMFEMMMGKTMEMCDADPAKCKMMMGSMQRHSNVMKSMKEMHDMGRMK